MKKIIFLFLLAPICYDGNAQCISPANPTQVTATPNVVCSNTGAIVNLNATSPGNTIQWYTVPSGGVSIGSSASGANFIANPLSTTTYYAEAVTVGGLTADTFFYSGSPQFYVVPVGIDSVEIDAYGAQGGNTQANTGGLGGNAKGWYTVTPGETLWVFVGGKGQDHNFMGGIDYEALGGWNGGGKGGYDNSGQVENGGGGGGASDVRHIDTTFTGRKIVAGGGGGSAGGFFSPANGGSGGGLIAGDGGFTYTALGGTGGNQSAGGVAATLTRGATHGVFGIGGNGSTNQNAWGSGGAGGGYYGGGGGTSTMDHSSGHAAAGGGGSSYVGGVTGGTTTAGVRSGDGMVIINYLSNCTSLGRTPVTVTIHPLPNVSANISPSNSVCEGTNITLSGGGANSYSWTGPTSVTDNVSFTISSSGQGMYYVTGTDANSCTNTDSVFVTVNPTPSIVATGDTTFCQGGSATLSATGGNSYVWSNGAGSGSTVVVSPGIPTDYIVTGTDTTTGCFSYDTVSVVVVDCSGIEDEDQLNVSIYPNPTSGMIQVNTQLEITMVEIINMQGKTVQRMIIPSSNFQVNLENFSNGVYIIRLYTNEGIVHRSVIKR